MRHDMGILRQRIRKDADELRRLAAEEEDCIEQAFVDLSMGRLNDAVQALFKRISPSHQKQQLARRHYPHLFEDEQIYVATITRQRHPADPIQSDKTLAKFARLTEPLLYAAVADWIVAHSDWNGRPHHHEETKLFVHDAFRLSDCFEPDGQYKVDIEAISLTVD